MRSGQKGSFWTLEFGLFCLVMRLSEAIRIMALMAGSGSTNQALPKPRTIGRWAV